MEQLLTRWGATVAIFALTGALVQAINMSTGAKAGDPGLKGVWFVWQRVFIPVLGGLLGLAGFLLDLASPLGPEVGYCVANGIVAGWIASGFYDLIWGSRKAWGKHAAARLGLREND